MDGTLTQLVQALIDAHGVIAQLKARVAELEAQQMFAQPSKQEDAPAS
jgi:hypothetical protein